MVKVLRWTWVILMSIVTGLIAWVFYKREWTGRDNRKIVDENDRLIEEGKALSKKIKRYLRG